MKNKVLAVGYGEKCPYCNEILYEDILEHLFKCHKKEVVKTLFPEKNGKKK